MPTARPFSPSTALLALAVATLGVGCRRPGRTAPTPAAPVTPAQDHCWWTVFRTPLPADTVAARFLRAFTAVGLTGAAWAHQADTAWAQAGPTTLSARGGGTYTARVVAYRRGDSTHFRHYVGLAQSPADTVTEGGRRIGLCRDLGRAAQAGGTAGREPDGEERLAVWRPRP